MSETIGWPLIPAGDACARLKRGARGLDVRSEGEFAQGQLPGFLNVPVLNDEQRHRVGLTYKQRGPEAAVKLGHELVDPDRAALVSRWTEALGDGADAERLIICWRGGLRSATSAEWLARAGVGGVRVDGGYKAIRQQLMKTLDHLPPTLVLSGLTGSGKTEVLKTIPGALDLEGLANHRGSAFGRGIEDVQPAQATFENKVGFALFGHREHFGDELLVEDEGALVGRNVVPPPLRKRILTAPVVVLEVPLSERIRQTFAEYVEGPVRRHGVERTKDHLISSLNLVRARLGGLRTQEITALLVEAFAAPRIEVARHEAWITRLLREYYDPMYEYGFARHARPVVFRGGREDVRQFLIARLKS